MKIIYQTLENRGNQAVVEAHGPYLCDDDIAWLGDGYYFWDTIIEPAHYWGKSRLKGFYIICKTKCIFENSEEFLDLVGNVDQIMMIRDIISTLRAKGFIDDKTTLTRVFRYLKDTLGIFEYLACRVDSTDAFGKNYSPLFVDFQTNHPTKLILEPAYQICVYDLDIVDTDNFNVVFSSADSKV